MLRSLFMLLLLSIVAEYSFAIAQGQKQNHSTEKKTSFSPKKFSNKHLNALKVAGGIAIPLFVVGECMMYTQFVKATYHWITHGKQARSFFAKQPVGATYELIVTIKRFGSSFTKKFESKNPKFLILEANMFVAAFIKKEYTTPVLIRIFLEPTIITKQGRRITLSPFYNLWDQEKGIIPELKKTFFSSPESNADQVFKAIQLFTVGSLMTLTAPLLVAAAYRLRPLLFPAAPTTLLAQS